MQVSVDEWKCSSTFSLFILSKNYGRDYTLRTFCSNGKFRARLLELASLYVVHRIMDSWGVLGLFFFFSPSGNIQKHFFFIYLVSCMKLQELNFSCLPPTKSVTLVHSCNSVWFWQHVGVCFSFNLCEHFLYCSYLSKLLSLRRKGPKAKTSCPFLLVTTSIHALISIFLF